MNEETNKELSATDAHLDSIKCKGNTLHFLLYKNIDEIYINAWYN